MTQSQAFPAGRPRKRRTPTVALPEPSLTLDQDAEWCVVRVEDEWRQIRFHDYEAIYQVGGLYEKVIYEILQCQSPETVAGQLEEELESIGVSPGTARVLDLGAGNGMVGEALVPIEPAMLVGVDITPSAKTACERDRPGLYDEYHIVDLTALSDAEREQLRDYRFNLLTCVAALGFGDIPPDAFLAAFDLIRKDGWIAFNIKERFLEESADDTGFSKLMREMSRDGIIEIRRQKRYRHRFNTSGDPLYYVAIVARKRRDR